MSWASAKAEDEYFAQRDAAIGIAVAVGVLRRCEYCGTVLQGNRLNMEAAYRLGNTRFTKGELSDIFDTRREMTDAIKSAENEHALDDCPRCAKLLED